MPKFKNETGKLVVFSENKNGKQVWYNVEPGSTIEVTGILPEQAAIIRGLTEVTSVVTVYKQPTPSKTPVKVVKPKKK